ncbi:MAG: hypothetical protein K2J90_12385 [Lachnospiraceae bacterium]|nr:hypothetical protein [Lachnospiraceae bacterium]
MFIMHKKTYSTISQKKQHEHNTIVQKKVLPITDLLTSNQSNILIQLKKNQYIPNTKEPHLHIHRGGITFTNVGHRHRGLVDGNTVRTDVINDVLRNLQQLATEGNHNAQPIIDYINNNILQH